MSKYPGYTILKEQNIAEINCVLTELEHKESGAKIVHLGTDDEENVFCLSFRTLPSSSNGVAHILEHTVLCGSKKFPVKDPFFSMMRRSMNTFMNAFTGSDFTCYPAASMVEKDFYNLLEVYLDSVFHPLLKRESFLQEGHRVALNEHGNLEFRGIVYNEMKGAMNSPDSRMWHKFLPALFPDLPYAYNSGGEPQEIPNLTYEEFLAFHKKFYDPSRCLFFFYGNLPLKKHLQFLEEKILSDAQKLPELELLPLQKKFTTPQSLTIGYPASKGEGQPLLAMGWVTIPAKNVEELLELAILEVAIMESDASPLKHALIESGACSSADGFLDPEMSEVPYAIVCRGVNDPKKLEEVLFAELKKLSEKPLPDILLQSAMHQIEFSKSEIAREQMPYGLTLFMRGALGKQHGADIADALSIHTHFAKIEEKAKDPLFFPNLIKKYFLDNKHFVSLLLKPDPTLAEKEAAEEKARLQKIESAITKKEKADLLAQEEHLEAFQNRKEDLSVLPKITLADVSKKAKPFDLIETKHGSCRVLHHSCFTNHILYGSLCFDLPHLEQEELPYIHLLSSMLSQVGMGKRSWQENLQFIQGHVGALFAKTNLNVQLKHSNLCSPTLHLRGRALKRNRKELFTILYDMAMSADFSDRKRIEDLINQFNTGLELSLNRRALRYAEQLASSTLSVPSYIHELWHGVSYFKFIQNIARNKEKEIPKTIEMLQKLQKKLFLQSAPDILLSCDEDLFALCEKENFAGLGPFEKKERRHWQGEYKMEGAGHQARVIASPVAFTSFAFSTATYSEPSSPAIYVAAQLMEHLYLHKKVREEGGAYGAYAHYTPVTDHFVLSSYRDPHLARTLEAFHGAVQCIASGQFNETQVEEAKLSILQQFDSPISPGSRAHTAYTFLKTGKTEQARQHYREKLMNLTANEIQRAAEEHLLPKLEQAKVVTFAGEEFLKEENKKLKAPLTIKTI